MHTLSHFLATLGLRLAGLYACMFQAEDQCVCISQLKTCAVLVCSNAEQACCRAHIQSKLTFLPLTTPGGRRDPGGARAPDVVPPRPAHDLQVQPRGRHSTHQVSLCRDCAQQDLRLVDACMACLWLRTDCMQWRAHSRAAPACCPCGARMHCDRLICGGVG